MRIRNTSQYPTERVKELVEFAMKGVQTTGLLVAVKNTRRHYRGLAYHNVPSMSPASKMKSVERLVTIGIGDRDKFPTTNAHTTYRKTKWSEKVPCEDFHIWSLVPPGPEWELDTTHHYEDGREVYITYRWIKTEHHPYGGKRSPAITMNNWEEALVSVAAHEARHVSQMRRKKPLSEVDAERFAAKRLNEFRDMGSTIRKAAR